jgi:transcriptional regulator with XRE-family HTH domain
MGTTAFSPIQEVDMASRITVRLDVLAKYRRIAGLQSDAEFAKRIGVNRSQVGRIVRGESRIGTRFIAGCLDAFGVENFADLFAVEPDDNGAAA